jgi:hypothetical protein
VELGHLGMVVVQPMARFMALAELMLLAVFGG